MFALFHHQQRRLAVLGWFWFTFSLSLWLFTLSLSLISHAHARDTNKNKNKLGARRTCRRACRARSRRRRTGATRSCCARASRAARPGSSSPAAAAAAAARARSSKIHRAAPAPDAPSQSPTKKASRSLFMPSFLYLPSSPFTNKRSHTRQQSKKPNQSTPRISAATCLPQSRRTSARTRNSSRSSTIP